MVTENIDIVVRERGARVVRRRIESIGDTAVRANRGLRLLQNTLFVLGAAGAVAGLVRFLDTLTNFENRIRLVTDSTAELNAVQDELFALSNRTRSSFEGSAEVYTRTALSVRELGVSQQEVLQFTESLNQAVILSGASAREANAALIQLGQGLASNRLSGDELRSVLEQLPFVADVIANQLGITRGELREFGREGKITGDIILEAFRNAREEIAERFAETIPTIGQAFQVLRNNALQTLDRFDDFTGSSSALALSIIGLANSLDFLVTALLAAAAGFAAFRFTTFVQGIFSAIAANRQLAAAVAEGNVTLLTATEIERAKAASSLQSAQASAANAAAKVRELQLGVVELEQNAALLRQQQASIVIDAQRRTARDALTGRFIVYEAALAQNIKTNRALALTERTLTATRAELSTATTARIISEEALTAAQTKSLIVEQNSGRLRDRLSRRFPVLANGIQLVARAFSGLGAVVAANPVAAIIAAIAAAVTALAFFSDRIKVSEDGVVTLRDTAVAVFQLIGERVTAFTDKYEEEFQAARDFIVETWDRIVEAFNRILTGLLNVVRIQINLFIALWVASYNSVVTIWNNLPQAFARLGALAINNLITVVETGIEGIVQAVGDLLQFIGGAFTLIGRENPFEGILDSFSLDLDRFKREVPEAVEGIGETVSREFQEAFSRDFVGEGFNAVLDRARVIAEQRIADLGTGGDGDTDPDDPTTGGGGASFAQIVRDLTLQNELLRFNSIERERLTEIVRIENQLKRSLTETERQLVEELLLENQALQVAADILEEIQQPQRDYETRLRAINTLLESGRISQDQFNQVLRQTRITFLETQRDIGSGFERGFLKALESASDFASQSEQIVTNAFDGMADALTDFITTGRADFGSLIQEMSRQIIRLFISRAFQGIFGGGAGGGGGVFSGGGGAGGIFGGLFRGLFGLQRGGSFTVGANTGISPLPGNDNRLVAFRAQDGEQIDVTPRNQRGRGRGDQNIVVNFNITTPDVESFRQSESQIAARAARVIAQGQRNL